MGMVVLGMGWLVWWPLLILGIPLMVYSAVVSWMFIYKAWALIQDGHARASPCKALGFLFIPFFNLYWVFEAYWGFAKDYNDYVARHRLQAAPKLPDGLFLALSILTVASIIPFLDIATGIAVFIIFAVIINKVCDAVNALPAQSTE